VVGPLPRPEAGGGPRLGNGRVLEHRGRVGHPDGDRLPGSGLGGERQAEGALPVAGKGGEVRPVVLGQGGDAGHDRDGGSGGIVEDLAGTDVGLESLAVEALDGPGPILVEPTARLERGIGLDDPPGCLDGVVVGIGGQQDTGDRERPQRGRSVPGRLVVSRSPVEAPVADGREAVVGAELDRPLVAVPGQVAQDAQVVSPGPGQLGDLDVGGDASAAQ
jgi:hypothetical protein